MSELIAAVKDAIQSGARSYQNGDRHDDVVIARAAYEALLAALARAKESRQ